MRWLQTLWRKAFPVRVVFVDRPILQGRPEALDDAGEPLGMDDLLPELLESFDTCKPLYAWLEREIARKEKLYHELAPTEPAARDAWALRQAALNAQLSLLHRAVRLPLAANQRIHQLKKLAEEKKATEAEIKAIYDYFDLESPEVP